jgi:phosphatidylserine/phosphatidylglycerophosphate/cardiolipin synthase-like enzyme
MAMLGQLGSAQQLPAAGSTPAAALSSGHHALYYTPEVNPERVDVPLLTKARGHIDAAFYSFTDKPIAEALQAAANRGVKVRIYRDQEQFENEKKRNPYMTLMFAGNRNIQIRVKGSRALMHLKAWSTDGLLRDGSSNLSAAAKHQDNSIVLSSNADEIQAFERKFAEMWNRPDNSIIQ